jgi:hypothetical protein
MKKIIILLIVAIGAAFAIKLIRDNRENAALWDEVTDSFLNNN